MAAGRAAAGKWARAMPGGGRLAAGRPSTSTPPLTMACHPATARRRPTGRSRPTATHRPRCDAWKHTEYGLSPSAARCARARPPLQAWRRRRARVTAGGDNQSRAATSPPPATSTAAADVAAATAARRLWRRRAAGTPALARCRLAQPGRACRAPTPRGRRHCRRRHRRPRTARSCDPGHPPRRSPATRPSGAGAVPSTAGVARGPAAADDAKLLSAAPPAAAPPRRPLRGRRPRGCAAAQADKAAPPPPPVEPVAMRPMGGGCQSPAGRSAPTAARRARWRGHRRSRSGGCHAASVGGREGRRDDCERGWRWGRWLLCKRLVRKPRQRERMYFLPWWSSAVVVGCARRVGILPKVAPRHATWYSSTP